MVFSQLRSRRSGSDGDNNQIGRASLMLANRGQRVDGIRLSSLQTGNGLSHRRDVVSANSGTNNETQDADDDVNNDSFHYATSFSQSPSVALFSSSSLVGNSAPSYGTRFQTWRLRMLADFWFLPYSLMAKLTFTVLPLPILVRGFHGSP